jgi:hypothetical protein
MSNQKSSGDDGSQHDGSRTVELNHIHDTFEDMLQALDVLIEAIPALRAFVAQQGGNVDNLPEERDEEQGGNVDILPEEHDEHQDSSVDSHPVEDQDGNVDSLEEVVEQRDGNLYFPPEEDDEHLDSSVDSHPAEDYTMTAVLEPDPRQFAAEALRNRVQAVIAYFLRRMNNTEVSEMLVQGMRGGIAPNPNTPLETKVPHEERMKKRRSSGMKYNKAEEACKPALCS